MVYPTSQRNEKTCDESTSGSEKERDIKRELCDA